MTPAFLEDALLAQLAELSLTAALAEVYARQLDPQTVVAALAQQALAQAEHAPTAVHRWLDLATALLQQAPIAPEVQATVSYAQARLYVQQGQLTLAEQALRAAQTQWQAAADEPSLARSHLGLTQILAMQGRYGEAEQSAQSAISGVMALAATDSAGATLLVTAYRNLATVLVYQEKHAAALTAYDQAQQALEGVLTATPDAPALQAELAHLLLNRANALMFLDRSYEAEAALHQALDRFVEIGDSLNQGRAHTNLGSLLLRTGRYALALRHFDAAIHALEAASGDPDPVATQADILYLDQANVYLALNLLPEAEAALVRCEALFRRADQPYELAQALLTLGLVRLRRADAPGAATVFGEAERLFAGLDNPFWRNRTRLAQASLAYQQGMLAEAGRQLDHLLAQTAPADDEPLAATHWDLGTLCEARLLRIRVHLARGEVAAARMVAAAIASTLGLPLEPTPAAAEPALPHLALRFYHACGLIAAATDEAVTAKAYYRQALLLLERQRATLPIEEIRTAFLDDKSDLYSALVLLLLQDAAPTAVAEAFALVERTKSRALVERLLATLADDTPAAETETTPQAALQQQLHLLYNRLLGESGSRHTSAAITSQIATLECALQQVAWRNDVPLLTAEPVDLATLQAALAVDQQAVVYYVAGAEVLAFVVNHTVVQLVRRLCTTDALAQAQAEWHFQRGRAELGADYRASHAARLEQGWRGALTRLYDLVLAPLRPTLHAPRLLFIPYGALHLVPLHALWDGARFVAEEFVCSYAPSATVAVHLLRQRTAQGYQRWAGFALADPAIPAAVDEVWQASTYFPVAQTFVDAAVTWPQLQHAAATVDVLHLATHGLFRPDNPFFSVLKLADGWVDVRTLYQLRLAARLVVLSACESGAGQVRGGDEVIGLARGFLAAGAQTLLVSLWNVHDATSAWLMDHFYRALVTPSARGESAADALRAAQCAAIRTGQHPYFWASFLVIGV